MKQASDYLLRLLEILVALGMLAIATTVVAQVLVNALFETSFTGANEIITKLFVYCSAIGAAIAMGRREHIAIDVVAERMAPAVQRWIDGIGLIAVMVLNLIVVLYSFHWIEVTGDYLMPTTQLPRYLAQLAVPMGAGLAVLFCVMQLITGRQTAEMERDA